MAWTIAQQKVIDTRNKNLLVSAAAGSGKTAVLVERIISMISVGEHPIDIDHLLVVTFTNAAAAEMRDRVGKAIDAKLLLEPDNLHLQKQMSLLQSAQITTIHSFCLNVIRNYFHRIDLDPSFKIAEESEITLMKSDVISDILERWYEEGREDFHAFVESYSYSKSDLPIEDLILQLYNFSMSDPWPKAWIARRKKMFDISSLEEMNNTSWMQELLDYVKVVLGDLLNKNSEAMTVCNEAGGPTAYAPALLSDRNILEALRNASSYDEYAQLFPSITYDRLSGKKEEGVVPWKKEKVKELREEVKKGMKDLTNQYFFQAQEEMLIDLQAVSGVMQVLFELTIEFMEEFAKKKEEKNLIDFNDLEHFALKILVTEQDERKVPTEAALELGEQFEEILIDEYQDSNMVQETILRSISKEDLGRPNRFMVGDVKQSIYKFRLAMPEIFMEKYGSYSCDDVTPEGVVNYYQRIDLDKNFRSREVVLDYVNKIFEQIMQKPVGGILYDEAAALKYGELYEETLAQVGTEAVEMTVQENELTSTDRVDFSQNITARIAQDVELLLVTEETSEGEGVDQTEIAQTSGEQIEKSQNYGASVGKDRIIEEDSRSSKDEEEEQEEAVYTKKELEARAIAKRIRELTNPDTGMLVFDHKTKMHRPANLRDVVILLRSMTGWSEVFVNTLMQEGISAYADTGTGYFQTLEIITILNMLRIIDNPRQDIPLVGVLYSPIVGLTTTELALLRAGDRNVSMYSALLNFVDRKDQDIQGNTDSAGRTDNTGRADSTGRTDNTGRADSTGRTDNTGRTDSTGRADNTVSYDVFKHKIENFLDRLDFFRSLVNHKPIHELIQLVLDQTGYYYYASAMPGGDQRKANIDMLIAQAVRFEKGSYSGLFHFIRYIEKLHKYEVDFGEAATSGEQDNTVRIMSIHKSKGLEFPIVFVAGMSKQFNTQDLRSSIVLHSELGVGPEYIDSKQRTKVPTLLKKVIQKKVQIENLGEELRVLYVAMTRAREKLILSGYLKSRDELKKKEFSFFELLSAKSYLDWVLPAMVNCMGRLPQMDHDSLEWKHQNMTLTILAKTELLQEEMTRQLFLHKDVQELKAINPENVYDSELKEEIKFRFNYVYPHLKEAGLKVKMTVSELKKLGQFQDDEESVKLYPSSGYVATNIEQVILTGTVAEVLPSNGGVSSDISNFTDEGMFVKTDSSILGEAAMDITVPNFIRQSEAEITGTDRGTLYHKVLELIDLSKVGNREELSVELERLSQANRLKEADIKKLNQDYIYNFVTSDVAKRMINAALANKLYKEKQFVMGIKASDVIKEIDSEELILIQGIIDVFFEEDGEIILLDYKSDLVSDGEQLVRRYRVQLEYYRKAIEQMLGKRVKEMIIYSLPLGKEIRIEE